MLRRFLALVLALCLLGLAGPAGFASAQEPLPPEPPEGEIPHEEAPEPGPPPERPAPSELELDYQAALEDEALARASHEDAVTRWAQLTEEIALLDEELAQARLDLADAEAELAVSVVHLIEIEVRLADEETELTRQRQRLSDHAVDAYIGGGAAPFPRIISHDGEHVDFNAFSKGRVYAQAVVADRKHVIERVAELVVSTDQLRSEADDARREAADLHDGVRERFDRLSQRRDAQAAARTEAAETAAWAAETAVDLEQERQDYERRYAAQTMASDSIGELLRRSQSDQAPPASTYGIFLPPVEGAPAVSGYGMRLHPILGEWRMHAGVDITAAQGEPVRASAAGTVVVASEQGGYGLTIVIDHGDQLATLYAHLSAMALGVGDVVEEGELIGAVGSTGLSTGPHVHWEVRLLGLPVDGAPYLRSK